MACECWFVIFYNKNKMICLKWFDFLNESAVWLRARSKMRVEVGL